MQSPASTQYQHANQPPIDPAQILWAPHPGPQTEILRRQERELCYGGARGGGKGLILNGLVLTPFGFKPMEEIKLGSQVTAFDGTVANVIGVYPRGEQPTYKFTFADGATTIVDEDHIWFGWRTCRKIKAERLIITPDLEEEPVRGKLYTTRQLIEEFQKTVEKGKNQNASNFLIPMCKPVPFTLTERWGTRNPVDPYLLGVLLGDGCITEKVAFCSADPEIIEEVRKLGYDLRFDEPLTYRIISPQLRDDLKHLKCLGKRAWEKSVPEEYLLASIEIRRSILQGLLDTDGYVDVRGHISYASTSSQLAKDVQWIVRSLGGKATITRGPAGYRNEQGEYVECRDAYDVTIQIENPSEYFRLSRKKSRCVNEFNGGVSKRGRRLVDIEYVGKQPTQCIAIDHPSRLHVVDDFIVTHNTDAGIIWVAAPAFQTLPDGVPVYPTYRGLVLRRLADDLSEWVDRADRIYRVFGAKKTGRPATFTFPSGAKIVTNHLQTDEAYKKYQGHEYQRMLLEEATHIPDESWYDLLIGSCRSTIEGLESQILLTANPGGPGHNWVKNRFVKVKGRQLLVDTVFTDSATGRQITVKAGKWIVDPQSDKYIPVATAFFVEKQLDWRMYIPAKVDDNPVLMERDPAYVSMLNSLPEQLKKAWRFGDWDSFAGQFFTEFRPSGPLSGEPVNARHVYKASEWRLEPWWPRRIALDWGYDHPAAATWTCQTPSGRIVFYRELVVKGVGSVELGSKIAERSINDLEQMPEPVMTLSVDPSAWGKRDETKTIAENIAVGIDKVLGGGTAALVQLDGKIVTSEGVEDKSLKEQLGYAQGDQQMRIVIVPAQNTRIAGWAHCREMLRWRQLIEGGMIDEELPKVLILDNCPKLIDCLGTLIHDEHNTEDVLKMLGDDPGDSFRYALMAWVIEQVREPLAVKMATALNALSVKHGGKVDPTIAYMVAQKVEADHRREMGSGNGIVSLPRRSSRRGKLHWLASIGEKIAQGAYRQ